MVIYGIENLINGKLYIGATKRNLSKRKYEHKLRLRTNKHKNSYLQNSWRKYGESEFRFFILEDGFTSLQELNDAENFWITILGTHFKNIGYNLVRDDGGSKIFSKDTIEKISKNNAKYWKGKTLSEDHKRNAVNNRDYKNGEEHSHYGLKYNDEWRNNISKGRKGKCVGKENPFYGKDHSKEVLNRLSKANSTPVNQYDKNGNFIKEWDSIKSAEKKLKVFNITKVCKGRQKTAGGFIWKYKIKTIWNRPD